MLLLRNGGIWCLLLGVGCSGIQTGSGGSEEPSPCLAREEPITDLSETPPGFDDTPASYVSPARGKWEGQLKRPAGDSIFLSVEVVPDEETAKALYYDLAPGSDEDCYGPSVRMMAELRIDGGAELHGSVPVQIQNVRGPLKLEALSQPPGGVETTLEQGFERTPVSPPTLQAWAEYVDGTWHGDWEWQAHVDCTGVELCSGVERSPLGSVVLYPAPEP